MFELWLPANCHARAANLSANRVDFSSSVTKCRVQVPTLFGCVPRSGDESVQETTWTNQHTSLSCEGKEGKAREKKRVEQGGIPGPRRLPGLYMLTSDFLCSSRCTSSIVSRVVQMQWSELTAVCFHFQNYLQSVHVSKKWTSKVLASKPKMIPGLPFLVCSQQTIRSLPSIEVQVRFRVDTRWTGKVHWLWRYLYW